MINKLDTKIKELISNSPLKFDIPADIEDNPLVGYLKIFQNQHRAISILYQGLILSFSGFVVLLSLLIFNIIDNEIVPIWGAISLGIIDIFLVWGVYRALRELRKYREKSQLMISKIFGYLRKDLSKIEKHKPESVFPSPSQSRIQSRLQSLTKKKVVSKPIDHEGWDSQICPKCNTKVEMLKASCPTCNHKFKTSFEN